MDYANGKIYKITNCENDQVYVGSTCTTLTKRFSYHKKQRNPLIHKPLYKLMTELGTDKFSISLIEAYPCTNHTELFRKEGEYTRELGTLNIAIAGRTSQEWYQDNREVLREKNKVYDELRKNNPERIEYIKIKNKELYEKNKEDRLAYSKQQWENNKDKLKEQAKIRWTCDRCGSECRVADKARHLKTKKCINFVTII
jgi:group I intron endonuclease